MVKTWVKEIAKNTYILRLDDDKIRYFEALWSIPEGITYNAYLLISEDKVILFDTWKNTYSDLFIETLKEVIEPRDIDYIVIHHMEPDHSGSLPKLLKYIDNLVIIGHPLVKSMIKSFYGVEPRFIHVDDGAELEISNEIKLRFIHTPWLHWPETIMTYVVGEGILFSCDAFGGFSIPSTITDENHDAVDKYIPYVRKYFTTVIGKYRRFVVRNIEKLDSMQLDIRIVAPAHGLVWRREPRRIIDLYYSLANGLSTRNKVVVIYSSMYGFIEEAMSIIINEIRKHGIEPVVYRITDMDRANISDILGEIIDASALIIGTATYESGVFPLIKYYIDLIVSKASRDIPVLIVSSYGWGGVAARLLSNELSSKGFHIVDIIEFKGRATRDDLSMIPDTINRLLTSTK